MIAVETRDPDVERQRLEEIARFERCPSLTGAPIPLGVLFPELFRRARDEYWDPKTLAVELVRACNRLQLQMQLTGGGVA